MGEDFSIESGEKSLPVTAGGGLLAINLFQLQALRKAGGHGDRAVQNTTPNSPDGNDLALFEETQTEKLENFMSRAFNRLDTDANGILTRQEVPGAMSLQATLRTDELQLMSWLSKNLNALEKLGDDAPGFSVNDLNGLKSFNALGKTFSPFVQRNANWNFGISRPSSPLR